MKLLWYCLFIGISTSSVAIDLFGDVELKDMSGKITTIDWIDLVEQMRNGRFLDETVQKFRTDFKKNCNCIDFPQKAASYDFSQIGIELNNTEREALKKVIHTFTMHAAFDAAQKEIVKVAQWRDAQQDTYKCLFSQVAGNSAAPAAE